MTLDGDTAVGSLRHQIGKHLAGLAGDMLGIVAVGQSQYHMVRIGLGPGPRGGLLAGSQCTGGQDQRYQRSGEEGYDFLHLDTSNQSWKKAGKQQINCPAAAGCGIRRGCSPQPA